MALPQTAKFLVKHQATKAEFKKVRGLAISWLFVQDWGDTVC